MGLEETLLECGTINGRTYSTMNGRTYSILDFEFTLPDGVNIYKVENNSMHMEDIIVDYKSDWKVHTITMKDFRTAMEIIRGTYPFLDLPLLINHPFLKYFALHKLKGEPT